jgi:hypothetical protein
MIPTKIARDGAALSGGWESSIFEEELKPAVVSTALECGRAVDEMSGDPVRRSLSVGGGESTVGAEVGGEVDFTNV